VDVSGVWPDIAIDAAKSHAQANLFEPWNMYPKPSSPSPRWNREDYETVLRDGTKSSEQDKLNFDDCTIPGEHPGWSFGIDVKGVFQVYDDNNLKGTYKVHNLLYWLLLAKRKEDWKPEYDIPDIREHFFDLELVLSVISDGPTKSFAIRRLQYLLSKFIM
jgi:AMP deaminase